MSTQAWPTGAGQKEQSLLERGAAESEFHEEDATVIFRPSHLASCPPPTQRNLLCPDSGHLWYLADQGMVSGPYDMAALRVEAEQGRLRADSLVWREGFLDWDEAGWVPELARLLVRRPPPASPEPEPELRGHTLSPVERIVAPVQRLSRQVLTPKVLWSPWVGMAAAVLVGLGIMFVVTRLWGGGGSDLAADGSVRESLSPPAETRRVSRAAPVVRRSDPERRPFTARVTSEGTLGAEAIRTVLAEELEKAQAECWSRVREVRALDAPDEAKVELSLRVDATGHVMRSKSGPDPASYPGLGNCVAGRALRWRFPVSEGMTSIRLELEFRKP